MNTMKTNFPTVEVAYTVRMEGASECSGRLLIPSDEWAAMDESERRDFVRSAALAAKTETRWEVVGGVVESVAASTSLRSLAPSSN